MVDPRRLGPEVFKKIAEYGRHKTCDAGHIANVQQVYFFPDGKVKKEVVEKDEQHKPEVNALDEIEFMRKLHEGLDAAYPKRKKERLVALYSQVVRGSAILRIDLKMVIAHFYFPVIKRKIITAVPHGMYLSASIHFK